MSARDLDRTEALRSEFVRGIVDQLGVPESLAIPYADGLLAYLQLEYAGERLYIPQPARQYDVEQIGEQLRRGDNPRTVARLHMTTVRQLHRMFPGGLPRPMEQSV